MPARRRYPAHCARLSDTGRRIVVAAPARFRPGGARARARALRRPSCRLARAAARAVAPSARHGSRVSGASRVEPGRADEADGRLARSPRADRRTPPRAGPSSRRGTSCSSGSPLAGALRQARTDADASPCVRRSRSSAPSASCSSSAVDSGSDGSGRDASSDSHSSSSRSKRSSCVSGWSSSHSDLEGRPVTAQTASSSSHQKSRPESR